MVEKLSVFFFCLLTEDTYYCDSQHSNGTTSDGAIVLISCFKNKLYHNFVFFFQISGIFQHLGWFGWVLWFQKHFSAEKNIKLGLEDVKMTSEIYGTAC